MLSNISKTAFFIISAIFFVIFLALSNDAYSGLIMEQVVYEEGSPNKQLSTIYVQDNKLKQVDKGNQNQPTVIFDLGSSYITLVNNENKVYIHLTIDEHLKSFKAMMQQTKEGEETDKNLTLEKSDESMKIAGYNTTKYTIFENGKLATEYWVSSEPGFNDEINFEKMAKLMNDVKNISQTVGGSASISDKEYQIFREIYQNGYPLKTIYHTEDGSPAVIEEILSVKSKGLPASEFEPPAGYKKITYQDILNQQGQ